MKIRVSDYIVSFFIKKKMFEVFGVTGGGAMHLNDSFAKYKKMNFTFFHHEQSASMAAEAFYRKRKNPCILNTTSGPGATNAVTGVTGAWIDGIPMFVVSGQVPTKDMINNTKTRQIGVQEINIIDIVKPIVKKVVSIKDPKLIDVHLNELYESMFDNRPGPVWLDVPLDIQSRIINSNKIIKFQKKKKKIKKTKINFSVVQKLIERSSRPIIVVGNGIHISKSEKAFKDFVNFTKIPVISSWNASDVINTSNKLYAGRMGIFGDRCANFSIENSDLIIVLGSRLSIPQTGYKTKKFAEYSKKIIVDIDKNELNRKNLSNVVAKYNIDLKDFITEARKKLKINGKNFIEWVNLINEWKHKYPVMISGYTNEKKNINSFHFIDTLSRCLKGNETIVTDMGTSFTCTMQAFKIKNDNKQRLFTSSGLAAMGFGLPGSIGAFMANKKDPNICITGDGGLMFNLQELQTVTSYKIPLKIFVIENKGYLTMKLMQVKNFSRLVGSNEKSGLSLPNFKSVAKSFNLKYFKLSKKNMSKQIKSILKSKNACLIEVNIPPMQALIPRVQNRLNKDGSFFTPKLDDLFPHLNNKILDYERKKATNIKNEI